MSGGLAAAAAMLLLVQYAPSSAGPSSAGMGPVGPTIAAANGDCPVRGSVSRVLNPASRPGAPSCAPTGSGPPTGYPPQPKPAPAAPQQSARR